MLHRNQVEKCLSKGGVVVREWTTLASLQCGPGSNPSVDAKCGLSLLLVLSFAPTGFSPGTPVFPSPQKPTFPNSNSARNQVDEEPLCGCAISKSLFIYLFIYLLLFLLVFIIHHSGRRIIDTLLLLPQKRNKQDVVWYATYFSHPYER